MIDSEALSRFASDMAAAFKRLADGLAAPTGDGDRYVQGPKLVDILPGHRQRAVYTFLLSVGEEGATTGEVNDGIKYDFSNTYTTLRRLRELGIVELLPGVQPQTWRLTIRYRPDASSS